MRPRPLLVLEILERRDPGDLGKRADVERPADPMQHVDHGRLGVQPAEAQRREPEQLREGAGHHHVLRPSTSSIPAR